MSSSHLSSRVKLRAAGLLWLLLAAPRCAGCVEQLAPGEVGTGVARLTIRNAAFIAKLVEEDTACGFSSGVVQRGALVQGQPGLEGAVTWTVRHCTITFPELEVVSHDCSGVETSVQGAFTVSATKRVRGTVTGNAASPVIPAGADAVHQEFDVQLDGFSVHKTDSPAALTITDGRLQFVMEPRIALSRSLGVCAVPTLDLSFSAVQYTQAHVVVADGDHVFPVDVAASSLTAQVGKWRDQENSLSGTVTVWGTEVQVPMAGDTEGLDTAYTAQGYLDSIACEPDLVTPVTYACPSLHEQVVHGAARLTVSHLGSVASLVDADTRCGFSSQAALSSAVAHGSVGGPGSVTFTLPAPCTITYPAATTIGTDCAGVTQTAQGTITVTGTKTLTGVLTGDPDQPVAPDSRDPAELALTVQHTDFTVTTAGATNGLLVKSGTLRGTLRPRVALDARSGICSNTTSIVEFSALEWTQGSLEVTTQGLTFQVAVASASLDAQSGTKGERTNFLAGVMFADGLPVAIPPVGAAPILDPSYDEARFLSTFSCKPGFALAPDDAACALDTALALNAARLLVLAAGTAASVLQNDTTCGFSALGVKTSPTSVTGDDGQPGTIRWDIQGCVVGQAGVLFRGTDCLGMMSYLGGTATATAHRVVNGQRNTAYVIFDSVIPRTRDALALSLDSVALAEFSSYHVDPGELTPFAQLVIHSGTLSGLVVPGLGERASGDPGVFDVATPVAAFTDITLTQATATLFVDGKRFTLSIPSARVSAMHGSWNGVSNTLSGAVVVGAKTVVIPPGTPLDPSFTQQSFDASYACTADLKAVIPPN